jgi:replicative DNA helicase
MPPSVTASLSIQPHSLDAEKTVLGALLLDPEAIIKISDFMIPEDFYDPVYRSVYQAIYALYQQHQPIDFVTVSEKLRSDAKVQDLGGSAFLAQLAAEVPTASHVYQYGQIVKTKAVHRRIIAAGQRISALGFEEGRAVPEMLEEVEKTVFAISNTFLKEKFVHIRDVLTARYERLCGAPRSEGRRSSEGRADGIQGSRYEAFGIATQ